MADIAISGAQLKKMLALAKKRDLAFAYCPGGKPKDDVFILDRKKAPELIGRAARAEGEGSKLAYGYASLSGKLLTLTCERVLPGAAKRLKRWLRDEKCPLNVKVLDADGAVVEEDIEDLPDDDFLSDVVPDVDAELAEEDAPSNESAPAPANVAPQAQEGVDAERLKGLKAQAVAVQAAVQEAPTAAQKTLAKAFKGAIASMKSGDLDAAEAGLDRVEQALEKLKSAAPVAADTPTQDDDPRRAKLQGVADQLRQQIDGLGGIPAADRLGQAHDVLLAQIGAGDVGKAAATAKALSAAIAKAGPAQPAPEDTPVDPYAREDGRQWQAARALLEPSVLSVLQRGVGDVSKLRAAWAFFTEKGEAGAFADAMRAAPGLKKLLAEAEAAERSEAEKDIPVDIIPFVKARLGWAKIRTQLMSEMMKLQNAILSACQGEGFEGMANDTKLLFSHLEGLDDRLEAALDAVVQAPDEGKRAAMKTQARQIVRDYLAELKSPFFQDVDGNNGFAPVKVNATATRALEQVDAVLSSKKAA
ncbi:hypothetical protein [Tateyamaria sp. ANG-S1]|uniref:hypothetical protein n=1 Tax=Tateyamaria sp. ANG-S1 TaxID=1577905 RepID=UPI00057FEF65|nr:hypothetical protein [Tateyamaria sp. ANG-S1]KIC47753.1 hypothetical protein RA29_19265 [Tateyamaria sp. ANG-S1]